MDTEFDRMKAQKNEILERQQSQQIIHIDGFSDYSMSEADKLKYAIAFLKKSPIENDDDCYAQAIAMFIIEAWNTRTPPQIRDEDIEQVRQEHATNQCTIDGCGKLAAICERAARYEFVRKK